MVAKQLCVLAGSILLSACAGLDVRPVPKPATNNNRTQDEAGFDGFRYYEPAPFLFVHSDGKGGLVSQIVYLPDTTRKMSAKPYNFLASNETTLTFENGILTSAATTVDETVVPAAFIDAISKTAQAAIKASALNRASGGTTATAPVPYLFKIEITPDGILLKGGPQSGAALTPDGKEKMTIRVTIPQQEG